MRQINALGDACPLPVIKTKKALSEMDSGTLEILVDNEIAVQNIQKYVSSTGCTFRSEEQGDCYRIVIEKQGTTLQSIATPAPIRSTSAATTKTVVLLPAESMGYGDETLGKILMKGFIFALTQLDLLPDTILLYNGGAKLSVQGAATLNDLLCLQQAGVTIMTCGTCLNHFGIADQLGVGGVTNMYQIAEEMRSADRILRP